MLQSMGLQRVEHDLATEQQQQKVNWQDDERARHPVSTSSPYGLPTQCCCLAPFTPAFRETHFSSL